MRLSRGSSSARTTSQIVIWLAALIISLGVQRFVVICSGPHCESAIELVHDSYACCDHERGEVHAATDEAVPSDHAATAGEQDDGCTDITLDLGTGPVPHSTGLKIGPPPAAESTDSTAPPRVQNGVVALLPPSTGPPRVDRTILLRATTVLLI